MNAKNNITKYACYTASISMSVVAALSPLLFITFRNLYGISFSMLGALVLINFCTQLTVDLVFSFFSHKINIPAAVKITPLLTATGLLIYSIFPFLFPDNAYIGLVVGTVIFSASGGFAEVLISPVIAALPAKNPEREMSKLHSMYAWGVVGVVVISTVLLTVFGQENWQWISLFWILVPLISLGLFLKSELPHLETPKKADNTLSIFKSKGLVFCVACIFLGGASECTMSQWSSSYLEQAVNIPKIWGDVFGVAMFAVMLGLGRTLYAKFGKSIYKILALGAAGATVCYIVATVSNIPLIGMIACALTGLCTAMLWPGSLIMASDRFPLAGVTIYALMAAGGDLGGAVGPQLVGSVVDLALASDAVRNLSAALNLTAEQLSMKMGLMTASAFPLLLTILYIVNYRKSMKIPNDRVR